MLRRYNGNLNEDLCGESRAAGGGHKPDAQEFRLHACDGARFPGGSGADIELLILRVGVRHGALQNDAYRRRRRAEDGVPAYRCAWVIRPREAGQRELRPRSGAPGNVSLLKLKPTSPEKSDCGGVAF